MIQKILLLAEWNANKNVWVESIAIIVKSNLYFLIQPWWNIRTIEIPRAKIDFLFNLWYNIYIKKSIYHKVVRWLKTLNQQELKSIEQFFQLKQPQLLKAMKHYLNSKYDKVIATKQYLIAVGDIPVGLVAHLDTVFKNPPDNIFYDRVKNRRYSKSMRNRSTGPAILIF